MSFGSNQVIIDDNNENIAPVTEQKPNLQQQEWIRESLCTKIYYYVDDQQMPYSTEVPISPSKITLADFKQFITRRNYKFYYKIMDPTLKTEVKTDIMDEHDVLRQNTDGRFELFLLSDGASFPSIPQCTSSAVSTLPIRQLKHYGNSVRPSKVVLNTKRHSVRYPPLSSAYYKNMPYYDDSSSQEDMNLFLDSNICSVTDDDDSQFTTTEFTSVSQQNQNTTNHKNVFPGGRNSNKRYDSSNKPYWTRDKRKRPKRNYSSILSSTFDDTEVSMALDVITVTFNLESQRPFGMSVVCKQTRNYSGIFVHSVTPNGLVALDGRIMPDYLLLEVNGTSLDDYDPQQAIDLLKKEVQKAIETRGYLKLTCSRGNCQQEVPAMNFFRPPAEPVRPIDPTAWVAHTNAARGLDKITEESENAMLMKMGGLKCPDIEIPSSFPSSSAAVAGGSCSQKKSQSQNHLQDQKHYHHFGCNQGTSSMRPSLPLTLIQNPSIDENSTSALSSYTVSSNQAPHKLGIDGKKLRSHGGVTYAMRSAVRRLFCLQPEKHKKRKR